MDVEALAVGVVQVLGDREHGVEPDHVGERERTHRRRLRLDDRAVDAAIASPPSSWQRAELAVAAPSTRLTMKPGASAQRTAVLRSAATKLVAAASASGEVSIALDDLDQPHHRGRVEEVQAERRARAAGVAAGELADRERRGVGGEDRVAGRRRVERGEDLELELELLGHRLDHEVDRAEAPETEPPRPRDRRRRGRRSRRRAPAGARQHPPAPSRGRGRSSAASRRRAARTARRLASPSVERPLVDVAEHDGRPAAAITAAISAPIVPAPTTPP